MLNNKYHALLTFCIIYIILFYKYLDSFTNLYNKNKGFLLSNSREQQELTIAVTAQTEHVPCLSLSETAPTFSKCLEAQEFVGSKSFSISSASPETRYFSPTQVWEPLSTTRNVTSSYCKRIDSASIKRSRTATNLSLILIFLS